MEEKKVRVCKKCGTELIVITEPRNIEEAESPADSTFTMVTETGTEPEAKTKEELTSKMANIQAVGKTEIRSRWPGQYQCPKCDPGGINFIGETQTEFKNIQGMSRGQEIELSMKAKEDLEKNESTVIWGDEKVPGKGWND